MFSSLKNNILLTLVSLLRRFIPQNKNSQKRILVVATTALGDTLWATPALESLRTSFPKAYIAVLTSPLGAEILKHNPWTDALFIWHPSLRLFRTLRKQTFDTLLIFHTSQRLVLPLVSLLGAAQIVGTTGRQKGLDALLTHPLPDLYQHEIVRRLKMVEAISGRITSETLSLFLQPDDTYPLPPGRWIALHPGSKDPYKRWPSEHFLALARLLQNQLKIRILLTGTEQSLLESLHKQIPGSHLLPSHLPFRAFASALSQTDLLISNDTGPFHTMLALKRPALGLFVPTDPNLCGPHNCPHGHIISRDPTCTPCLKRKCRRPFCFLEIGPQEVFHKALTLLEKPFS